MFVLLALLTIVFHLVLPAGTAAVLAARPPESRIGRGAALLAFGAYGVIVVAAGSGWAMLGGALRGLVAAVVAGGLVLGARAVPGAPWRPHGMRRWIFACVNGVLALWVLGSGVPALAGARSPEGNAVELALPLGEGTYRVVHGGANAMLNHHAAVAGQRYALDVVKLGPWGVRAAGLMPHELERYASFGAPVLAPCAGEVLSARTDLEERPPLAPDPADPAGNHVLLYCDGLDVTVILAHLRRGSVAAAAGDRVALLQRIGDVGNTGNTSEPHLHVHAVRGRVADVDEVARRAEPVPIRFGGRFLVRNDVVRSETDP